MTKKVKVDIVAQDKTKNAVASAQKGFQKLKNSVFNLKTAFAGLGAGLVVRSLVQTGKEVESLRVRFKFLFGSAQEGSKAFDALAKFAGKVPFSLEEISRASGNLAVVAKDAKQLENILEITGNVAAATGLDFETTASQIQRSFAGGIASADIFREKGVRNMLGFSAGAKVSAEETIAAFNRVFAGNGEFAGTTQALAETFEGTLSMLGDKLFTFKNQINEAFFVELKAQFGSLNQFFAENEEATERLAKRIGQGLANAVRTASDGIVFFKNNLHLVKGLFVAIIGLKVASVFSGIAVGIIQMRNATVALTTAMKANLLFGAISLAIAAVVTLNDRLKQTKITLESLAGLDNDTLAQQLENQIKLIAEREQVLAEARGQAKRGAQIHLKDAQEGLVKIEEAIALRKKENDEIALTAQELARVNALRMSIPLKDPEEVTKGKGIKAIQDRFKTEETLLFEKFEKEKALIEKQLNDIQTIKDEFQQGKGREATDQELALFQELLNTKTELEKEYRDNQFLIMEEAFNKEVEAFKQKEAEIQAIRAKNLDLFKQGKFAEMDMNEVTAKDTVKMGRFALQEGAKINKEMFRLNQALNIGEAIMNTAKGVTAALGLGNIPLAIAIGAFGAIQVATIASQQPPAQFGGARQAGSPFLVGEKGPELFTPATAGTVTPNHQMPQGSTVVNFNINTVSAKGFNELLSNSRGMIVNMINSAVNEKGRANLV